MMEKVSVATPVFTKSGLMIANGYIRVVHGGRGDYIEISPFQIIKNNIRMPYNEKWRMDFDMAYYLEYRTKDKDNIKIYYQLRTVKYADYRVGYYYISVKDINPLSIGIGKYIY